MKVGTQDLMRAGTLCLLDLVTPSVASRRRSESGLMSPDLPMSRRAVLKLAAWGGAGLVASACTDKVRSTTPEGSLRPTTP